MDIKACREYIAKSISPYLPNHSRVHRINNDSPWPLYIKRDDELSFSISGSKMRKYSSLIPYLVENKCKRVVMIGGAYSNNILGLAQLLIENGITPVAYLRKPGTPQPSGNFLFIKMVISHKNIHLIERERWPSVEEIVQEKEGEKEGTFIVPEGAFLEEAFAGALTLPLDIARNEKELGLTFSHILVDAGSGLQAIAMILGAQLFLPGAKISVLLLADSKELFEKKLARFTPLFCAIAKGAAKDLLHASTKNYSLHTPKKSASFGSTSKSGFLDIIHIARSEGLFVDPIYSGKLLHEATDIISSQEIAGNQLIVHSGGALTLAGFQKQLTSALASIDSD